MTTVPDKIADAIADVRRGHRIHEYEGAAQRLAVAVERHFESERILGSNTVVVEIANENLLGMSQWLDDYNRHKVPTTQLWERVGKIGEENGEVIGAMIGWGGQNPRKGRTHDQNDVEKEIFDVVITGLGALFHLHGNDPDYDVFDALFERLSIIDGRRRGADMVEGGDFNRRHDYIMGELT